MKLQEEAFKNNRDLNNEEIKLNKQKKSTIESKIQKEIFYKLLKEDIEKEKNINFYYWLFFKIYASYINYISFAETRCIV